MLSIVLVAVFLALVSVAIVAAAPVSELQSPAQTCVLAIR